MRKIKLGVLIISLFLGLVGTCLFGKYQPQTGTDLQLESRHQLAWWGGLYPEYCLPGAVKLVQEESWEDTGEASQERQKELPVKIRFKYLTFLNPQ